MKIGTNEIKKCRSKTFQCIEESSLTIKPKSLTDNHEITIPHFEKYDCMAKVRMMNIFSTVLEDNVDHSFLFYSFLLTYVFHLFSSHMVPSLFMFFFIFACQ